jgi:hypothetical protein
LLNIVVLACLLLLLDCYVDFSYFCHFSPNSSSSSSSPPKNVTLYCHNLDEEEPLEDTSRNRPLKKCRSYNKSKRSRRRQGSHSSADRSPATKRSPASSSESKICLNEQHGGKENGFHVNPLCSEPCEVTKCKRLSKKCSQVSCPRVMPGCSRTSTESVTERRPSHRALNSSDSGPHPASSCESDEEDKNESVPNELNIKLPTCNNNKNLSKRTRGSQDEPCLTASSEDGCESSDFETELAHSVRRESFDLMEEEEHVRRIVEQSSRPSLERYEVRPLNYFHFSKFFKPKLFT